ncbi:hypothetical protein [Carnimonas bestiolae]|uniref:hypothetical protein n=1 Tax=Carnimonas bestiolae TaxID=3402172 RepID=UPI003EDBB011
MIDIERQKEAQELYELVVEGGNKFLRNARLFELSELRMQNPSFEELSRVFKQVSYIVASIVDDIDPTMAETAIDCSATMEKMAFAVQRDDKESLDRLVDQLEQLLSRPFTPTLPHDYQ